MPFLFGLQLLTHVSAVCHIFAASSAKIRLARWSNIVDEARIRETLRIGKQGSDG
jgi:hypothetical protein